MSGLSYAGVGSRSTPAIILTLMTNIGKALAMQGYTLRSGGADGADSAFEQGCDLVKGQKEIYLPWKGFNKNLSKFVAPSEEAYHIASQTHPYFANLKDPAKFLMARNTHQILGANCKDPCAIVICWTQDGADNTTILPGNKSGGTGQAIRLAAAYKVPVHNLSNSCVRQLWETWLASHLSS